MKLDTLKIRNYRSYSEETVINFDKQFTSFIGKNDVGKSSIFDALDVFLGERKLELSDLSVDSVDRCIEITCIFSELPDDIEIDTTARTTFKDEFLLNKEGYLEIKKIYKCTERTVPTSPEIFIVAEHPSNLKVPNLHTLDQRALKELGDSKQVTVSDARVNNLWRKAIWSSYVDLKLESANLKIDDFESKAKKIYSKIEELMPMLFVFRADREMTDADSEAKDPMQVAVAEAQESLKAEIDIIKDKIQARVEDVTKRALEKLHEIDPALANKLNPVLKSKPTWKFEYKIEDEKGVALNKRGSGTRRLVLLNFFRAQAEKKNLGTDKGIIYAIEEPETSQHPDNQKLIIDALSSLASDSNRQVMITSHSPELLKGVEKTYPSGIRFIQNNSNSSKEVEMGSQALILSAKALGILSKQEFGSTEKVVLVEGKKDCLFLEHASDTMKQSGEILSNFSDAKVQVLHVGGCTGVKDWVKDERYKGLGLKTYVFLDSDRLDDKFESLTENEIFINSLSENFNIIKSFSTKKREIENYIKKELTGCEFGDYDDVKKIVPPKTSIDKSKLIDHYWTQMKTVDIDQEIKEIIKEIIK